ncbi:MAG: ribonuclease [Nevskia sp.]|nr:ribonuclease [Nevskia sp.]
MKRILINATQREELRVAIVDGQKLYDLDIELASHEQRKSNIYKGRITRVEASLEACFVEYGAERHGFLPLKEIHRDYYRPGVSGGGRNIRELIAEGSELIVQVEKEERGNKGAALTSYISLAGRFLVLMPNNPKGGGISRRVEGEEREEAREALAALNTPEGMSLIVRTNGIGRDAAELQGDLDQLTTIWQRIADAAKERPAPFLVYQENNIVLRALRDYLRPDIGEVIVDNPEIFEQARAQMAHSMPQEQSKLKLYRDSIPLFSRYQIESQIESAHDRTVRLPSGGSIVIDHGEALTAIDINSAKATSGGGIEETALQTNLEAAEEIARQLRLRDLGGLIVIDFIDMNSSKNQREVEKALQDASSFDRARVQLGRLSRFGLLEMSRQRLRPSLGEHTQIPCPRCSGRGQIRSVESMALSVLRLVEEECMKDRTGRIIVQLPVDVATYLLNEKRATIGELEARFLVMVTLVPNETLQSPNFEIMRVRQDHLGLDNNSALSYRIATDFAAESRTALTPGTSTSAAPVAEPAVKPVLPVAAAAAAPVAETPALKPVSSGGGFWAWLKSLFASPQPAQKPATPPPALPRSQQQRDGRNGARPQEARRDQPDRGPRRDRNDRGEGRGEQRRDGRNQEARGGQQNRQPNRDGRDGAREQNRDQNRNRDQNQAQRQPRPPQNGAQQRNQPQTAVAAAESPRSAELADEALQPTAVNGANAAPQPRPAGAADAAGERGEGSRRRRGRRGRGRGGRGDGPREGEAASQQAGADADGEFEPQEEVAHDPNAPPVRMHGRASELGPNVPEFGGSLPHAAALATPIVVHELAQSIAQSEAASAAVNGATQQELNLPAASSEPLQAAAAAAAVIEETVPEAPVESARETAPEYEQPVAVHAQTIHALPIQAETHLAAAAPDYPSAPARHEPAAVVEPIESAAVTAAAEQQAPQHAAPSALAAEETPLPKPEQPRQAETSKLESE